MTLFNESFTLHSTPPFNTKAKHNTFGGGLSIISDTINNSALILLKHTITYGVTVALNF